MSYKTAVLAAAKAFEEETGEQLPSVLLQHDAFCELVVECTGNYEGEAFLMVGGVLVVSLAVWADR